MDHTQYLLTLFFTKDNSFFKYISKQDNETALDDINTVKQYLDFLLWMIIESKNKLEALGDCYAPLSENFRALIHVRDMRELRKIYDRPLINMSSVDDVVVNHGYLSDFVISLMRLIKEYSFPVPKHTNYIDPRDNPFLANMIQILHGTHVTGIIDK